MPNQSRLPFASIRSEGALLPSDLLQRIAAGDAGLPGVDPDSYHIPANEKLSEAISRSWARLTGVSRVYRDRLATAAATDPATGLTRERWLLPLFEELGYGRLQPARAQELDGRSYPISHFWNLTPVHLVGANLNLDTRTAGAAGAARISPHGLVQDFLNRSENHVWGFVSNGRTFRVLRDNLSLTRQAYLEFDLEMMMTGELFSDFAVLWLVCHQSRVEGEKPQDCRLERWMTAAREQGVRALDDLRLGVERAVNALGSGFLSHPANCRLRGRLRMGSFSSDEYYRQLLRLVYQLLFLFSAEDREVLLSPASSERARDIYRRHYSTARLRDLAERHRGSRHPDLYAALRLIIQGLGNDKGLPGLGLAALGGFLFSEAATPDIQDAELSNGHILEAIRALAFVQSSGKLRRVDFKNLGSDEFGSVYESLLELHPEINVDTGSFALTTAAGSERKTTGSYYTPTSLINCLLDTALDPVLAEAAGKNDPEKAILALRICDPACGSGHFLVAAAHRVAKRLAGHRTGDEEPSPAALRTALRDIVGHCLYGVDINPMAVELCKVALWMEAVEPGKPLSFLDHHVRCGNSLLGATPKLLADGIPDEAFKPIEGDDKREVTALRKKNREQRKGQLGLLDDDDKPMCYGELAESIRGLDAIDDLTIVGVHEKESRFGHLAESPEYRRARLAADAWCAAFVWRKTGEAPYAITHDTFLHVSRSPESTPPEVRHEIERLAAQYQFFHWHIAFPDVFRAPEHAAPENDLTGWSGGFDVVLGNPPWERIKIQEKEWFASSRPDIANAPNSAARRRLIDALATEDPTLHRAYLDDSRKAEGESHFVRSSEHYPLCGRGDVNTYAVFAELKRSLISNRGRVGCIVPSGIATDDTTKWFFADLVSSKALSSLYSFWETRRIFIGTDSRNPFCLLTLRSSQASAAERAEFAFELRTTGDLKTGDRVFNLSAEDIALLNPNTHTCPIFRSKRDAEITKAIYARVPVLIKEGPPEENPWGISFMAMLHMANDSPLFRTREQLEADGWKLGGNIFRKDGKGYLPLYEAKMIHHFDHRFGDYTDHPPGAETTHLPDVPVERLQNPDYVVQPRYWVPEEEVADRLREKWGHDWFMGWRDICRSTDERTVIASILPRVGCGDTLLLMLPSHKDPQEVGCLLACLDSTVADYAARQKVGGTHLKYHMFKQLAVLPPSLYSSSSFWSPDMTTSDWVFPRVLELSYTAWDLAPLAKDCGYDGPPFRWDEERRFLLRCELDAGFFHLYGVSREDADYIMDTFPIIKRKDETAQGEYRTKRVILEVYDAMHQAAQTGIAYRTLLDPPPADPSVAHPPREAARVLPFRRIEPRDEDKYRTCVPLYTLKAAAGAFSASQSVDPDGWVEIQATHKLRPGMFVAQVTGHSMEPKIPDGSYCLFASPVEGTREGRILLVQHHAIHDPEAGGTYTVKRYHSQKRSSAEGVWEHAQIQLAPINPAYEPIELRETRQGDVMVIAEVIEIL